MNMATQLATTEQGRPPIVTFRAELEQRASELKMALPSHISPEKFQRTVITAATQNPGLLQADRRSLLVSCIKAAQDGLLPDGREAALVPFNQRYKDDDGTWRSRSLVQYMPMVYGLRKKILQVTDTGGHPVVRALEVGIVYRAEVEAGRFLYEVGMDPPIRHRPSLDLSSEQAADDQIVAAYSIATMADGTKSVEVMRRFEIDKVQNMSQTGARFDRFGKPREPSGPWKDWYPEMAKKTVVRRHSKTLPMTGDVILDLGTEDDELDAGASTAALLGGTPGGEPQAIEDRSEEVPHDTETGEVHDADANKPADAKASAPKAGKAKLADKAKANDPAPAAQDDRPLHERMREKSGLGGEPNPPAPPADEPPASASSEPAQDDGEHPQQAAANSWLAIFEKAETVIDLERHYERSKPDRGVMGDDVRGMVEAAYDRRLAKLKGGQ
jgi:recombination protein RecT